MYMLLLFGILFLLWILENIWFYIQEATGHFWFAWPAWNKVKLSDFGSIAEHGVSAWMRVLGQFLCWARMSLRKWAEAQTGSYSNTSGIRGRSCRENVPSQHLANVTPQPAVSLHSLTREHPGRARSAQREGILLFRELGGRSRANFVTWILQKQVCFASSRKFTDMAEVLLAPAVVNWVSDMCSAGTVPLWSQLWLSFMQIPLTPKQSPFPFESSSWHQGYLKKKNQTKTKKLF